MPVCIQVFSSLCLLWGASALVNGAMKGEKDKEVGFGMIPYNSRNVYVHAAGLPAIKFIQGMHLTGNTRQISVQLVSIACGLLTEPHFCREPTTGGLHPICKKDNSGDASKCVFYRAASR